MPSTILDAVDTVSNKVHYLLLGDLQPRGGDREVNQPRRVIWPVLW